MLLSDGFPYLMITPGFILLVFVVIFPILFGFAIAFTNYNLYHPAGEAGGLGGAEKLY